MANGTSGDHTVEVAVGGVPVPGSPFLVKAYDASKVKVTDITPGIRGKPVYFSSECLIVDSNNNEFYCRMN